MELTCDVLVVGGGCGGVAAALAATDLGRTVILTEIGRWVGGQLTSQAVPPDEHPWVESTGVTARYRRLRDSVRTRYKQTRRLTETAKQNLHFNPGAAWVSNLSAEPTVFREVLDDMLRPAEARGLLHCLIRHRPIDVVMDGDHIAAVRFEDLQTGDQVTVKARYVLEATEEGDLLPLTGCESVVGAESAASTGEPMPYRARLMSWTSRPSRGVPLWSGGQARTTPSTVRRIMSSGRAIRPTSGRALNWAGGRRDQRPAAP